MFDLAQEIVSYRFWLMLKIKCEDEVIESAHDKHLIKLKKRLFKIHQSQEIVNRSMIRIMTSSYNTIPEEYWRSLANRHETTLACGIICKRKKKLK